MIAVERIGRAVLPLDGRERAPHVGKAQAISPHHEPDNRLLQHLVGRGRLGSSLPTTVQDDSVSLFAADRSPTSGPLATPPSKALQNRPLARTDQYQIRGCGSAPNTPPFGVQQGPHRAEFFLHSIKELSPSHRGDASTPIEWHFGCRSTIHAGDPSLDGHRAYVYLVSSDVPLTGRWAASALRSASVGAVRPSRSETRTILPISVSR